MSKTEKIILIVFAVIVVALLAVFLLRPPGVQEQVVGEFTPPEFDSSALSGAPDVEHPEFYGTLNLGEGIAVSMYSAPIVTEGAAQVYFTSPESNTVWVRLRITDEKGNILGQTGLVRPGEYVEYITLETQPKKTAAVAKILTYQPETYYSMGSAGAEIQLQIK
ncbi:MAG: hypothetical protein IJP23_06300 [Oscillospiraceae bacterium]|nr:hypothetical protein [Oscillospiraceae bacterium]